MAESRKVRGYCHDNCRLYDPSGELIGLCNMNKLDWYKRKGLGEMIDDKTMKLNFIPNYRKEKTVIDEFRESAGKIGRENICVGCGSSDELSSATLVPKQVKRCYPTDLKRHRSDLIVVLCRECLDDHLYFQDLLKDEILADYGYTKQDIHDKEKLSLKQASRTLLRRSQRADKLRLKGIEEIIKKFFNGIEPSKEELEKNAEIDTYKLYDGKILFEYIIDDIIKKNQFVDFENRCLIHFYKNMEPQFVPTDLHPRFKIIIDLIENEKEMEKEMKEEIA